MKLWRRTLAPAHAERFKDCALRHPGMLRTAEQAEIRRSLGELAARTSIPAGLHVGETVLNTMRPRSFGRALRKKVNAIRSYSYALLQGEVLIIDPKTNRVLSIVAR